MRGKSQASKEVCITKDCVEEAAKNQLCKDVAIGDVIWVKLNGSSWWHAQVVDENSVSGRCKPSKRAEGEVLARLYGSYKYLYIDWIKCRSEFVIKFKENNGNYHEIIVETLKQDLLRIKSGRSKRQESKTKAMVSRKISTKTTEAKSRKRKQGEGQNIEPNSPKSAPTSTEKPQEPSARKMKVMQSLALIAPSESPFHPKHIHFSKKV